MPWGIVQGRAALRLAGRNGNLDLGRRAAAGQTALSRHGAARAAHGAGDRAGAQRLSVRARDADVMEDLTDIEMRCANLVETFQAREVVGENRLGIPMAEQPASNAADLDQRGLQI